LVGVTHPPTPEAEAQSARSLSLFRSAQQSFLAYPSSRGGSSDGPDSRGARTATSSSIVCACRQALAIHPTTVPNETNRLRGISARARLIANRVGCPKQPLCRAISRLYGFSTATARQRTWPATGRPASIAQAGDCSPAPSPTPRGISGRTRRRRAREGRRSRPGPSSS
jgi:hypothetical protein